MFKRNEAHGKHCAAANTAGSNSSNEEDSEVKGEDPADQKPSNGEDLESRKGGIGACATETVRMEPVVPAVDASAFLATPMNGDAVPQKKGGHRAAKIAGIVAGSTLGLLLVVYVAGALFFTGHFYPNTTISHRDISLKSTDEVASVISQVSSDYTIHVSGKGLNFAVSSADMGINVDGQKIARAAVAKNNAWTWPVQLSKSHDVTDDLVAEYNSNGLEKAISDPINKWNETAEDPVNATLAYNEGKNAYDIVPERTGTKVDVSAAIELIDDAVLAMKDKVELTDDQMVQPQILKDNESLLAAQKTANGYVKADLKMIMHGDNVGEINADQISQWVTIDDEANVSFDEGAMDAWLTEYGNGLDTVGSERAYTRPGGKQVTVSGGTYGWEVDTESLVDQVRQQITEGAQGDFDIPIIVGGAKFTAKGEPDWVDYIDVDLSEQHAYYFNGSGEAQWESDVITGRPDGKHDTPTGVWTLFSMQSPATLKGEIQETTGAPEYETKVQYWMPFTYSGCGLHDATWQPSFGGSLYAEGLGSHGCVNLPYDAAQSLYGIASVGIPVIVHW